MNFFVSGRTEIIGNHTDHQDGCVIAGAVALGITAEVTETNSRQIRLRSQGYGDITVDLDDLSPRPSETGSSAALVRGMAAAFRDRGLAVGGFDAALRSDLPDGGGLSSSAAFSVLMGRIFSALYNGGGVAPVTIAKCARAAENVHFDKPSGLMDQLACALGTTVYIDFAAEEIVPLAWSPADMGLVLCLTDTGGSHADLTEAYAAIPGDMRAVAEEFGQEKLRYVNYNEFLAAAPPHDPAHDRARHFFGENGRAAQMRKAMEQGDRAACLALMNGSGRSSETLLKNVRAPGGDDALERGLALSGALLEGKGAWRVHGGGFAGCVQALVPTELFPAYRAAMDGAFGAGRCFQVL